MVWPEVVDGKAALKFGNSGYRDALCDLIGRTVEDVDVTSDETIVFGFDNLVHLSVSLSADHFHGEKAIFAAPGNILHVWSGDQ